MLQSYPRLFNKYFGVDVWTRLLEIAHVKKAKHGIPEKITKGFIIEGYFDYPILFPWIFSFFSKKTLLKIQGFVSPFFDVLQNYFVFFLTYQFTSDLATALAAQLIYALTPMIPIENSYMTPRSLGYFMFTLAFLPLLLFHIDKSPFLLIIGFIFTTLLFITHRFALQSLLFISVFFTFVDKSPIYLSVFILGAIAIIFLTKGYYLRVLKGHLYNIYFWIKNYKYRFAHQIYGNQKTNRLDWVNKIYRLLSYLSPVFLLGINPWVISGVLYLFFYYRPLISIARSEVFLKMSWWIIFFYIFAAIVLRVKRLIPIGEGQRYLEMTMVPSAILSAILFRSLLATYGIAAGILFAILALISLVIILFVQIKGIIHDKNRSLTSELKRSFNYINKIAGTPRIMCIPHQITTMTVYNTKADVLVNADNPGLMQVSDFYPIIKKKVKELKKIYNLDYLLLRETFIKASELKIKKSKVVFKSGNVLLIKL